MSAFIYDGLSLAVPSLRSLCKGRGLSATVACSGRGAGGEEHPLHATLPLLVEVVGQPEAEPAVAALAARCACFIAALDPWYSAGANAVYRSSVNVSSVNVFLQRRAEQRSSSVD